MVKKKKFSIIPYLFIAPHLCAGFLFSAIMPWGVAFSLSFMDARVGFEYSFAGIDNYLRLFPGRNVLGIFGNQAVMTVTSVFNSIFLPLAAELLFFVRRKRIANVVKTAFVIPMLVPGIVNILTWRYLYNNDFGFNTILKSIGLGVAGT